MHVDEKRAPICSGEVKRGVACAQEMIRVGTTENWVWACLQCDCIDTSRALDLRE